MSAVSLRTGLPCLKIRVSLPWLTGSFFSDAKQPRKVFGLKNEYLLIPPDYLAND